MRFIGSGPPVRIIVTRAEYDVLMATIKPAGAPSSMSALLLPPGVPVIIDDRLTEGVVICASEVPDRCRVFPEWRIDHHLQRDEGDDE